MQVLIAFLFGYVISCILESVGFILIEWDTLYASYDSLSATDFVILGLGAAIGGLIALLLNEVFS